MKLPRVMLAALKSGSGKTILTCGLLQALKDEGLEPGCCKCGPDYIDPMFHRKVLGVTATNLDTYFTGVEKTKELLLKTMGDRDIVVMEGAMGLFDGVGGVTLQGSAYHLAQVTKTPIILVVDVHGMGYSMIPLLAGFLSYDKQHLIRGIILNRISSSFYETMVPYLEKELRVKVLGYFENHKDLQLESRHLGLKMPEEIVSIREQLLLAGEYLKKTVDVSAIKAIAEEAVAFSEEEGGANNGDMADGQGEKMLRLAVARDAAFCFYYEENLSLFREMGVETVFFSPLTDETLPEDVHGLLLGGGYPELYGEALSKNEKMKKSIYHALKGGMPSLAECGGFMYLHKKMNTKEGSFPMVGLVDATVSDKKKLVRFGYVELYEQKPIFLKEGESMRGHEFHYYDSSDNGKDCLARKPMSERRWQCCMVEENHCWGFPHFYYGSNPHFVEHFVAQMKKYKEEIKER